MKTPEFINYTLFNLWIRVFSPDGVGPYFSPYSVFQLRMPIDVAQQTELEMESPEFQFNIFAFLCGEGVSQSVCVYL